MAPYPWWIAMPDVFHVLPSTMAPRRQDPLGLARCSGCDVADRPAVRRSGALESTAAYLEPCSCRTAFRPLI